MQRRRPDSAMGSSDDDDDPPVVDIQAHIRPLLKKLKKQEARIDKLEAKIKENEKRDRDAVESQRSAGNSLAEVQTSLAVLKDRLESGPWREDNDKLRQELVGHSTRLQEALEEQRVQLNAHAQVFQSTQTSVVQQQHDIAALQAETSEARRRGEGDLASLSTRVDQLRSETSERDTSNFTEATQHADRLAQRLQQDVLRLEQQLALCAQSRHVSDQVSALQQEVQSLSAALEEAKRTARASAQQLQEARDQQSGYALQSSVSTMQQLLTTRLGQLEEGLSRVDASQHATAGVLAEGRFDAKQQLLEQRQMRVEREQKQLELQQQTLLEQLSQRPLKVDLITAVAQLELGIEACATATALEKLEATVKGSADGSQLRTLAGEVGGLREAQLAAAEQLQELRTSRADRAALAQTAKEVEALRVAVDVRVTRDELSNLLAAKQDRAETRGMLSAHEALQAAVAASESKAQKAHDALSQVHVLSQETDKRSAELRDKVEGLHALLTQLDGRLSARKAELSGVVKVLRAVLEDAEMRIALDESAEGAPPANGLAPVSGGARGGGGGGGIGADGVPPLQIKGLHGPGRGAQQLAPLSPTSQDKVWYKSSLVPRGEVLAQRRRLLVGARHSWVGDTCLARAEDAEGLSGSPTPRAAGGAAGGAAGVGASPPAAPWAGPPSPPLKSSDGSSRGRPSPRHVALDTPG